MSSKLHTVPPGYQEQTQEAENTGDWESAAKFYAQFAAQRERELSLINSVQEGLSSKLDMQDIYDLVGDKLRDTFNAQIVMISQYDPIIKKVYHHYAIERGQHLYIQGWQPLDSSRAEVVRTRKPFMINGDEILEVLSAGKMRVVPGTEVPKCWLGVPMLMGSSACGIVSLQNLDKENAFSKADIDLLMTLTNSMTLSLENARLFSETQRLLKLVEGEMQIARRTQRSILPARKPRRQGYDFGALIAPARAVGGDFYDFIPLGKDRLSLVIGDVSDKGLPAALIMALTFSLIRAEAESSDDPEQVLRKVNRFLMKMNASEMFVTLLYGVLETSTGKLRYGRAGHLPPIGLGGQGEVIASVMEKGQPLGIFEDVELDIQEINIPQGGLVLLFSDGLNEAVDGQGGLFGFKRIEQELSSNRHQSAQEICASLWEAVNRHSGDLRHQDDFVTVVVKRLTE
jgi:serine phosphatase RsbU (regulator of sigma subunit)